MRLHLALLGILLAGSAGAALRAAEPQVDFNREIRPILAKKCFVCHGTDEGHREAGLRLDVREAAIAKLDSDAVAIVPGEPGKSELVRRIAAADESERMPPAETGITLTDEQQRLLKQWIAEGASYAPHWAYVKPIRPALPAVKQRDWPTNEIDYFILSRLEQEGIRPMPRADRYTLIRRASLDLRGLPPTPAEVQRFIDDADPLAYQRLVDRLLEDSAFGERWARMWLDQARYADSRGYGSDPLRPNIWRYRDWVIDAFNSNMPFDQFTREQLAGDLLPGATIDQRVATAFHRNTMTNTEGGTDDEEFRVAAVKDRVDTTMQVWMGITFGCAKCHSHKYEPITQQEYYELFAIFNQTADSDKANESPTLLAPSSSDQQRLREAEMKLAELRSKLEMPSEALVAEQAKWEAGLRLPSEWQVLETESLKSSGGTTLQRLDDGSILASGESPATADYEIAAKTALDGITAFRLEALADEVLPGGGPGRSATGNFVLSQFSVTVEEAASAAKGIAVRFVRIELPGKKQLLSLAEVQAFAGNENIAVKGKAIQSSTAFDGPAQLAIDGDTNGHYSEAKSTTHTGTENNPWWEVDLGSESPIDRIVVWNRTDGNLGTRLAGYRVQLLDAAHKVVWQEAPSGVPNPQRELAISGVRNVGLASAVADFSQAGFAVESATQGTDLATKGWAIAPQTGKSHWAAFIAAAPIAGLKNPLLRFTLQQQFEQPRHTLGRFRLSATTDRSVLKRTGISAEILALVDTPAAERSAAQQAKLAAHYRTLAPSLKPLRDEIAALEKARPTPPAVPVMQELPIEKRRATHIMVKGNFLSPGEAVEPALPSAFHHIALKNKPGRMELADWLLHDENPLTARVAVNRLWAQIFGIGIVETEEDFGIQGELPSHPALLDYLATEFVAQGWDTKKLIKSIVTSQAYCQSARVAPEALAKDPRNRWLSRGPRFRLEAEMVRDQALALSGLLSRKLHGPSVFPPQPAGLWQAAFNGERTWATSSGEDKYRRGLYTFWRRTTPYPSMATFDAPSREICALRRIRTNTPLQAFVTLNDPVYVEAAQALARRMARKGGDSVAKRASFGLQLCLVRPPTEEQIRSLVELFDAEVAHYRNDSTAAKQMIGDTLGPIPEGVDQAELAAWTVVANVLLNLDAVLMKG
jgi:hypothetical protein